MVLLPFSRREPLPPSKIRGKRQSRRTGHCKRLRRCTEVVARREADYFTDVIYNMYITVLLIKNGWIISGWFWLVVTGTVAQTRGKTYPSQRAAPEIRASFRARALCYLPVLMRD